MVVACIEPANQLNARAIGRFQKQANIRTPPVLKHNSDLRQQYIDT
jgi:hypothetical protein